MNVEVCIDCYEYIVNDRAPEGATEHEKLISIANILVRYPKSEGLFAVYVGDTVAATWLDTSPCQCCDTVEPSQRVNVDYLMLC